MSDRGRKVWLNAAYGGAAANPRRVPKIVRLPTLVGISPLASESSAAMCLNLCHLSKRGLLVKIVSARLRHDVRSPISAAGSQLVRDGGDCSVRQFSGEIPRAGR